jgi:hypothetical protein
MIIIYNKTISASQIFESDPYIPAIFPALKLALFFITGRARPEFKDFSIPIISCKREWEECERACLKEQRRADHLSFLVEGRRRADLLRRRMLTRSIFDEKC